VLISRAKSNVPSLQKRRISLHHVRRARAMQVLKAGVPAEWVNDLPEAAFHQVVRVTYQIQEPEELHNLEDLPGP